MRDIRIAAITCKAPVGKIEDNLTRTIRWTLKAKEAGADLVCFPELNITGYCNRPQMAAIAQSIPDMSAKDYPNWLRRKAWRSLPGWPRSGPRANPMQPTAFFHRTGNWRSTAKFISHRLKKKPTHPVTQHLYLLLAA